MHFDAPSRPHFVLRKFTAKAEGKPSALEKQMGSCPHPLDHFAVAGVDTREIPLKKCPSLHLHTLSLVPNLVVNPLHHCLQLFLWPTFVEIRDTIFDHFLDGR